jgi:guanylate kinase
MSALEERECCSAEFIIGCARAATAMSDSADRESSPQVSVSDVGLLVVLSAPSGVGKTATLMDVVAREPKATFSVSVTTRPPRPNERSGKHYTFVRPEMFDRMIEAGELLEWTGVYGARYGTPRAPVLEALERGQIVLLDVDGQGATQVKAALPQCVSIFLAPPSLEILERRLRDRGTESEEGIQNRLQQSMTVIATASNYDYFIINHDIASSATSVLTAIRAEQARTARLGGEKFVADFCRRLAG